MALLTRMALSRLEVECWLLVTVFQACAEDGARLLHEFVTVPSPLEYSRFDAAGAVGDFAVRDLGEQLSTMGFNPIRVDQVAREQHPRREHVLTGARETDVPRLLVVQQRGRGGGRADQVVTQQRRPQFFTNHLGRLATHMTEIERLLDRANIQFLIPAKTIELRDVFCGVDFGVGQRGDDGQCPRATPLLNDVVADLA
jgi:hypothetical protein